MMDTLKSPIVSNKLAFQNPPKAPPVLPVACDLNVAVINGVKRVKLKIFWYNKF